MTQIKTHQPCNDCGSSDALTYYENSTYCFSCQARHWTGDDKQTQRNKMTLMSTKLVEPDGDAVSKTIVDRGITKSTCEKYGVVQDSNSHWFPYHNGNEVVAYKKRSIADKKFSTVGDWREGGLFGQHLFNKGGKYVTLVEGEWDALACYQMLGSK